MIRDREGSRNCERAAPVQDALRVEIPHARDNLKEERPYELFCEELAARSLLLDQTLQVAAVAELHDNTKQPVVYKTVVVARDERAVKACEEVDLGHGRLLL